MLNKNLKAYILLWSTQALSALGSGMTSYAFVLWLYLHSGSALKTALLSVCSYAPYVIMSIFAGAFSDKWNKKKTMLACDFIAEISTVIIFILLKTDNLHVWHLYLLNAINGFMNTFQQPASEVATTLLIPEKYYQKTSGLRSFSQSVNSILTPIIATAIFSFSGIELIILIDFISFIIAFMTLLFFIKIPECQKKNIHQESLLVSVHSGLSWLNQKPLILNLILFLSCINLVASIYDTALPVMILSKNNGSEKILGLVNTCVGIATLVGSIITTFLPAPKNRVQAICIALFISMGTENFMLAFSNTPIIWCMGAILGWLPIPFMNANMDVIFRSEIPPDIQGRIYSCRNTMQFFTIPIGFLLGGLLIDNIFEPFMANQSDTSFLILLFGIEKGSGTALLFFIIGIIGMLLCLLFSKRLKKYQWRN